MAASQALSKAEKIPKHRRKNRPAMRVHQKNHPATKAIRKNRETTIEETTTEKTT
jgi:hypothetical protein